MAPSIWQLLIVLVIVLLLFGTKKLRNLGGDLGSTIKSFRSAMKEGGEEAKKDEEDEAGGKPAQLSQAAEEDAGPVSDQNKQRDRA